MSLRRHLLLILCGVAASLGASYPTPNFLVEAPTAEIAQQVGQAAESYRREKALEWLGQEMPPWQARCPLRVKLTLSGPGGATTFAFDRGQILSQHMQIEGPRDRLLASVLPHEVTHTVFAYYFRCPVPRWADEGGAVLSEDELEKDRHDRLVRQILNSGRAIPLRRLFSLREYPNDVMALYAQGYSVANFLVYSSSKPVFLAFVAQGMQYGWDHAVHVHYRYRSVEELEQAWLNHLISTKRPPQAILAQNTTPRSDPNSRVIVRLTAPPAQPLVDTPTPIFRGQSPAEGEPEQRPQRFVPAAAGYLPGYVPPSGTSARPPSPVSVPPCPPPPQQPEVRLGPPQAVQPPPPIRISPAGVSPVGYPQ